MRILIIKLSSMGDIIHALPAISDMAQAIPGIAIDWVVDRSFADIPAWHYAVNQVVISDHRRWKKNLLPSFMHGEISSFVKTLRKNQYDFVIDLHGGLKSAAVALFAKGVVCGYDGASVIERGAQLAYKKQFFVARDQHGTQRMRQLLAQALNYKIDDQSINYGIDHERLPNPNIELPKKFVVFVHCTSWSSKNWSEQSWQQLLQLLNQAGYGVVLTWGSEEEQQRSMRIAENAAQAVVLPALSISQKAHIIAQAQAVIGGDTGLTHIGAALGIPTIALFGPTDPQMYGTLGTSQRCLRPDFACLNCHQRLCNYGSQPRTESQQSACWEALKPSQVWNELQNLLSI